MNPGAQKRGLQAASTLLSPPIFQGLLALPWSVPLFARMKAIARVWLFIALSFVFIAPASWAADLAKDFASPPNSAKPWVYWFWLNGNITSNGITADLEAMRRVGIGGVLIMEVDQGTPKGPAAFGSAPWRQLFHHVCAEASRLGLEVNMNNDAGWCGSGGPWITPELAMQKIVSSELALQGPRDFDGKLPEPPAVGKYYGDIAVFAFPTPAGNARIENINAKAAFVPERIPVRSRWTNVPREQVVPRDQILDLTRQFESSGRLSWKVPAGNWTVLRFGHTLTGKDNHPAPEAGRGLESDKLSEAATDAVFDGLMRKLVTDSKPLAGRTLVSTHIDSWETGSQNWTPRMREEFRSRRGYDLFPMLPVVTGRVVDSVEISERFLWDLRQTVSDLIVRNYAGRLRKLAHQNGLRLSIEAYDGAPCDEMTYAGQADEPMAEFWSWGFNTAYSCTEMASSAHVYGKRILGAEAFTATDSEKWLLHPGSIKALGDWAFCEGINRFVFHRYALQPWASRPPGMSMGPWGLHYERTQTWWEQSKAWHEYLARCQYLLRQGLFVADICFLQPEGSPQRFLPSLPDRSSNTPERPRYNFDGCTAEALLTRMTARDGKLVLPDGMSYRLLVLPQVETMTPPLLRKVKALVAAGATVVGPPPAKSPSLSNYPACDTEVKQLAAELWSETEATDRKFGKGQMIWRPEFKTAQPKDSEAKTALGGARWIWRREGNPSVAAPPGHRYFRREFSLNSTQEIASARLFITADNSFEISLNSKPMGGGGNFNEVYAFDAAGLLKSGSNVLAVDANNASDSPNPAGLIAALRIEFRNGQAVEIFTDRNWRTAAEAAPNWMTIEAPGKWEPAMELGPLGMAPWGWPGVAQQPAYVYPEFSAIARLLERMGVPPDFEGDPKLRFIHRRDGATDIYFVANSDANALSWRCAFRVSGKRPELWDPMSGQLKSQASWEEKNGQTFLTLNFEPAGSMFVIFREPSPVPKQPKPSLTNERELFVRELDRPWKLEFEPGGGAPDSVALDKLISWSEHPDARIKYFAGHATYRTTFPCPGGITGQNQRVFLDLGRVQVIAEAKLNGKQLGTLWKTPYRVDITEALQPGENALEVRVVNLWINRMIGDEQLAEDSSRNPNGTLKEWPAWIEGTKPSPTGRFTFTSWRLWKRDSPLQESGLIGPVRLEVRKAQ